MSVFVEMRRTALVGIASLCRIETDGLDLENMFQSLDSRICYVGEWSLSSRLMSQGVNPFVLENIDFPRLQSFLLDLMFL
uniref:Uncharacterized protein n=1 Tax=Rhizophora mucronata TaxID=61149 RepID=A0A2P2IYG4_RHIMU